MRIQIIVLVSLLLCWACTTETIGSEGIETRSYIMGYCDLADISVAERFHFTIEESTKIINPNDYTCDKKGVGTCKDIALELRFDGDWISEDRNSEQYERLCKEIEDISFNKKLDINIYTHRPVALTEMIDHIRILVNEDYSEAYPAGSDVSALFTLFYEHPYAVVKNNYQSPAYSYFFDYYAPPAIPQAVYEVNLAEADLKGKKALGCTHYLLLNGAPDQDGSYTFTVEVTKADGKILTTTTKPIPIRVD